MDRRVFIGTLAGGLLAAPLTVEAQQAAKVPRIGYLSGNLATGLHFREVTHAAGSPPNNPPEQTVGSPSLAAAAQWARYTAEEC